MRRTLTILIMSLPLIAGAGAGDHGELREQPRPEIRAVAHDVAARTPAATARATDTLDADRPGGYRAAAECHSEVHDDPQDRDTLDVSRYVLQFDCDEDVWTIGLRTVEPWDNAAWGELFVFFDTDSDPTTGYQGYDHTLLVFPEEGELQGGVFRSPSSDIEEDWELTAVAQVDRAGEPDFVGVVFPHVGLGEAEQFRWTAELYGTDPVAEPDVLPDTGTHDTTLTRPAPAPAVPEARGIEQACPPQVVPAAGFADVADSSTHAAAVDCVGWWNVARGLTDTTYGPARPVTRAQMASFLVRLIDESGGTLPASPPDAFADDDGSVHEVNIDKLFSAGVVKGVAQDTYNPNALVSRAQMATFLVRAYEQRTVTPLSASANYFPDDDAIEAHAGNIDKAAAAGFTGGRTDGTYGPTAAVRRGQMASFLARVLDLLVEQGFATRP